MTWFLVIIFLCCCNLSAQENKIDLESELKSSEITDLKHKLEEYINRNSGTVEALYFGALIEEDAQKSTDLYNQIIIKFPESNYAADALNKIGQYYFSRGLYISARKYFQELITKHPRSELNDTAMYFAAACLCAAKEIATCRQELEGFISKYPQSELVEMARFDLKDLNKTEDDYIAENKSADRKSAEGNYALQIGAFSKANNALNLRNYFSKNDIKAEIKEKKLNDKTIYFVLVGSFENKQQAEVYGEELREKHGKPYRVVRK